MKIIPKYYKPRVGHKFWANFGDGWRDGGVYCILIEIGNIHRRDNEYFIFSVKGQSNFYLPKNDKTLDKYLREGELKLIQ